MSTKQAELPILTAAVLLIGNELLSGRTKDVNLPWLAEYLAQLGIIVREARVVADDQAEIVVAVNALRQKYTYVFTTGGIGPTHDDITAESIAAAFGIDYGLHPEAWPLLQQYYCDKMNDARARMAKMPVTATLIDNPASIAPGFQVENVFVMAGVPKIMQAMMLGLDSRLARGRVMHSHSIVTHHREGEIAQILIDCETAHPGLMIGSYPKFVTGGTEVTLVLKAYDEALLRNALEQLNNRLEQL